MRIQIFTSVFLSVTALTAQAGVEEQREAGLQIAERVYSSENPEAAIEGLNQDEFEALQGVMTPGDLEVETETISGPDTRAYSGCYAKRAKAGRKALLGNTLYTYWQTTQ